MGAKKGMFRGDSHADGGIPSKVVETGQLLEIEGDEYYICREAYGSSKQFDFKGKTNKQILDTIYTDFSCTLIQSKMSAGDFIICKIVVKDSVKHDRKGTVKSILNEMQGEKSCKVESGDERNRRQGGGIGKFSEARKWWGNDLSFNEQREYAKKHLQPYEYNELLGSTMQYSKPSRHEKFINEIWEKEGKPKSILTGWYNDGGNISGYLTGWYNDGGNISGYFTGGLSFLNW